MRIGAKELIVVGDRILVLPDEGEVRTKVGLLLPPGVKEKEDVRGGRVVAVGPGIQLPAPQDDTEPWKELQRTARYMPMQVELGDYALFFRKAAIEISFEEKRYLIVPYAALLVLMRGGEVPDQLPDTL
ncbi:MAG: co-chaperone GroES [Planctomycetes bacterium]|nr:co-chaperone GroES [Planctomycetota bacterium]